MRSLTNVSSVATGLLGDTVDDAASTRKVYLLAAGLVVLGLGLVVVTIWFWRNTRHDPDLLGPLEVMDTRRFRSVEERAQHELLDAARPAGAHPMRWGVVRPESQPAPELVDLRALDRHDRPAGYEDLRDDPSSVGAPERSTRSRRSSLAPTTSPDPSSRPTGPTPVTAPDVAHPDEPVGAAPAEDSPGTGTGSSGDPTGDSTGDSTAETMVDDLDLADHDGRAAGDLPGGRHVPLLIVPVDHELDVLSARGAAASRRGPLVAPISDVGPAADGDVVEDGTADEAATIIDPLLRRFDRSDG